MNLFGLLFGIYLCGACFSSVAVKYIQTTVTLTTHKNEWNKDGRQICRTVAVVSDFFDLVSVDVILSRHSACTAYSCSTHKFYSIELREKKSHVNEPIGGLVSLFLLQINQNNIKMKYKIRRRSFELILCSRIFSHNANLLCRFGTSVDLFNFVCGFFSPTFNFIYSSISIPISPWTIFIFVEANSRFF